MKNQKVNKISYTLFANFLPFLLKIKFVDTFYNFTFSEIRKHRPLKQVL